MNDATRKPHRRHRRSGERRRRGRGRGRSGPGRVAAPASANGAAPIWLQLVETAMNSPVVSRERAIYTNRTLRYERTRAVGFDFDHTLALYNCQNLDRLAMNLVIDRLISHESIPASLFDDIPEPIFARKGLLVDTALGIILKIDRYGHATHAYRGTDLLSARDRREIYGEMDVIPHVTQGDRFVQVDSAFAKPEVLIFATVARHLAESDRRGFWKSIRRHTDTVHQDGSLKSRITAQPLEFLDPDPDTLRLLHHLRDSGKKVFLLTNSEWEYTRAMMNPSLGLDAPPEDTSWLELFDLVVVEARKPGYFSGRRVQAPEILGPDTLIQGGSIVDIEERLACGGPEVLYVGDHIYADLISSKRQQHWRTMMVIAELDEEREQQLMLPGIVEQLQQTDDRRVTTEREVNHWSRIEKVLRRHQDPEHGELLARLREHCAEKRRSAARALRVFIRQRESLRNKLARATNRYWGSLFRTSNELTYYGRQLEDFADLYASRATHLAHYSPDHYFRSMMDYLPHELEQLG